MNGELWVVMTTVANHTEALALARQLVEERLVACAQVLPPMTSIYRWQAQVQEDNEHLVLLKVPSPLYPQLEQRLQSLHPYTEPEIVALSATQVSQTYLQWALDQTA